MKGSVRWQSRLLHGVLRWAIRSQPNALVRRDFLMNLVENNISGEEERALNRVIAMRRRLAGDHRSLEIRDYGTGGLRGGDAAARRSVSSIYRTSAIPHRWGVLLFRFVRLTKPKTVLELGTNLGVSAAYVQSALDLNKEGYLVTIEGDPALSEIARKQIAEGCSGTPALVVGAFDDALPQVLRSGKQIDIAFIDGHHEFQPTMRYFGMIKPSCSAEAAVIFDDISFWSRPVRNAWKEIVRRNAGGSSVDFGRFGILFPGGNDDLPPVGGSSPAIRKEYV